MQARIKEHVGISAIEAHAYGQRFQRFVNCCVGGDPASDGSDRISDEEITRLGFETFM